jgi:hypothetical protein
MQTEEHDGCVGVFMRDGEPKRFKRYPYGPLGIRLVSAILCALVGIAFVIGDLGRLGGGRSTGLFLIGAGLIVVGIAGFFVARWMAKRNL